MSPTMREPHNIVIIGGGIIGCTTAYYVTRHPSFSPSTSVTIVEASLKGAAEGASGKAGGLVAKWAYPRELVNVSFREHVKLAEEHGGKDKWGWRYVECGTWEGRGNVAGDSGTGVGQGGQRKSLEKTLGLVNDPTHKTTSSREVKGLPDDLTWVKEDLTDSYSSMASSGDTAQVHPYLFTNNMLILAKEKGAKFIQGKVISIQVSSGRTTGVVYISGDSQEESLPATDVILCAGAWSNKLLPALPISATRAHSIVIRPQPSVMIAPYVLFTEISLPPSQLSKRPSVVTPEIYARPDNEVYACGPGDSSLLPDNVDDVLVDQSACESILQHVTSISQELKDGTVIKRQACFLPVVSSGGGPVIGETKKFAKGLFVATGHTCWGICNAPGTAKAIAELVLDGRIKCAKLAKLDPARYF